MRVLVMALLLFGALFGNEVEIEAKEFIGSQQDKTTHLKGNVKITRGEDRLRADDVFVYFSQENKPQKIHAKNNVKFWITFQDGRKIQGRANEAFYWPKSEEYQIIGQVFIQEMGKLNQVKGEKVLIKRKQGQINVLGGEAPARLIFKLDKKEK